MNALGIIFSELHDKNIPEFTSMRTLASVPFGGRYRFIDFMLSNMVNSGINKVGVITKSNYRSLMDHIGSGKSWDLSRKNGGLIVLPPHGESADKLFKTRFEALKSVLKFIKDCKEEYVVLTDCDSVCNIKLDDVVETHIKKKADVSIVYREKNIRDSQKLVFKFDQDMRVVEAYYTIEQGKHDAWTDIMVLKKSLLVNFLENGAMLGINGLSDIITNNLSTYKIYGYKFEGFYASVDSMSNYFKHSLELLEKDKRDSLFNVERPIYTKVRDSAPARFGEESKVSNSLIADGCVILGEVVNSVLFRGVRVNKGARIENSIIMQGGIISENCSLQCVIADKNVVIRENRTLAGHERLPYYIGKNTIL